MLKKFLVALLLLMLSALCAFPAAAETAQDITLDIEITSDNRDMSALYDRLYTNFWRTNEKSNPYIEFSVPEGIDAQYLYICFGDMPEAWAVQEETDGEWVTAIEGSDEFYHVVVKLNGKHSAVILTVLCLMEFEYHLVAGSAENFNFSSRMGHTVFYALSLSVDHGLSLLHNLNTLFKRELELVFNSRNRAALENIVRHDAACYKLSKKLAEDFGVVVYAAQKNGLIFNKNTTLQKLSDRLNRILSQLSWVVKLGDYIELFPVGKFL